MSAESGSGDTVVQTIDASAEAILAAIGTLPESSRPVILDSCGAQPAGQGDRLIAAWDPFEVIGGESTDHPLAALGERLAMFSRDGLGSGLPAGAAIGALSYDLGRRFERIPSTAVVDVATPDVSIGLYDRLVVHEYGSGQTTIISTGLPMRGRAARERAAARAAAAEALLAEQLVATRPDSVRAVVTSNFDRRSYSAAVRRAQEYIAAGDIYQVNLTQRFTADLGDARPINLFRRLRDDNPAAFAAYLCEPGRYIVSSSPERFLRVAGRSAEMWPIKGTRPRGSGEVDDARMRSELLASEKDRAENVMIVDLVRNDLGRVAEYGSVRAEAICDLQTLPTVFHLVSRVSARLADGASASDLLRAAFPCGSITGAPKIRAMEIIEELEGVRRGVSMGAIGYASFDGVMDWSVAIRTIEIHGSTAYFNVGGGVVADSDPEGEYEESLWKARALLAALGVDTWIG